jgi:Skp family chaperone for outer membrane proteins
MKFDRLGWIVAAVLAGGIAGAGFQDKNEKTGSVDVAKVFNESDLARKQNDILHTMGVLRESVFQFLENNMHMKSDDADKFMKMSLKEDMSAAEKAQLEILKTEAQTNETNFKNLNTKPSPTPAEVAQLEEYNKRSELNSKLLQEWQHDFLQQIDQKRQQLHNETMLRVKESVIQVAKKQGYSIVFNQDMAPYTANDLTTDTLTQMNNNKK